MSYKPDLVYESNSYYLEEKLLVFNDPTIYLQQYIDIPDGWESETPPSHPDVIRYLKNIENSENIALGFYRMYSDAKKVAIDLGSWIGFHSVVMAKLNKKLISVECDPISMRNTKYNLDLNDCCNYTIWDKPISKEHSIVTFGANTFAGSQGCWNGSCSMVQTNPIQYEKTNHGYEAHPREMSTITFSDIVNDLNPDEISLIKIDIEASEEFVLQDILEFCKRKVPVLCSFHIKRNDDGNGWLDWWLDQNLENKKFLMEYDYYEVTWENGVMCEIPISDIIAYLYKFPLCEIIIK
tara:strand:- start:7852 stop:8736 length:885 start_codon:yes stop_codon:yes gene_type:complete